MILAALALLAADPIAEWDGLPIPDEVGTVVAPYIGCLFDPLERVLLTGQPAGAGERMQLVAVAMKDCAPLREAAARESAMRLATVPGWTDPATRTAKIARMLDAAEDRTSFAIVSREDFLVLAESIRRCAGNPDAHACPR